MAGFTVSVFMVVSEVLFTDEEESTLTESAVEPDLLLLHAVTERVSAIATTENLNAFFMGLFLKCWELTILTAEGFVTSRKVRESESP